MESKQLCKTGLADVYLEKTNSNIILLVKLHSICTNKDDYMKLTGSLNRIYNKFSDKNIKFSQIYDVSETEITIDPLGLAYAKSFSEFLKSHADFIETRCYSTSIMLYNDYVAKFLNKFLKMYDNRRPVKLVNNMDEARSFIDKHVRENNFEKNNVIYELGIDDSDIII